MMVRAFILAATGLFLAFMLEHLPMPDILSWLQPSWVLLMLTLMVLRSPVTFGLWMAVPFGLMLDVEHHSLLGTHVVTLAVHIFLLQVLYRRMMMFHFIQQTGVVFVLVVIQQLLMYWSVALVSENMTPVMIWSPALTSALVWPWVYAISHTVLVRTHLS